MSEDQDKQPVVDDAAASAKPDAQAQDARSDGDDLDLDKLIANWKDPADEQSRQSPEPAKPEPKAETDKASLDYLVQSKVDRTLADRQAAEDAGKYATELANEYGVTRRIAMGWLDQMAREEPAVLHAFRHRQPEPKKWERMWQSLRKEFGKEHKQSVVDPKATEDREAVTAAVRGASTKAPEQKAPDYSKLTPAEFQAEKERLFG